MTDAYLKMLDNVLLEVDRVAGNMRADYECALRRAEDPNSPIYIPHEVAAAKEMPAVRVSAAFAGLQALQFQYRAEKDRGKVSQSTMTVLNSMMAVFRRKK
jgi:hypothetical protein